MSQNNPRFAVSRYKQKTTQGFLSCYKPKTNPGLLCPMVPKQTQVRCPATGLKQTQVCCALLQAKNKPRFGVYSYELKTNSGLLYPPMSPKQTQVCGVLWTQIKLRFALSY